jgi:hypothetical protein
MARINTDTKWSIYASNKQIGSKQYIYAGWPMLTFEWMSFKEKEVFVILDKNHDCSIRPHTVAICRFMSYPVYIYMGLRQSIDNKKMRQKESGWRFFQSLTMLGQLRPGLLGGSVEVLLLILRIGLHSSRRQEKKRQRKDYGTDGHLHTCILSIKLILSSRVSYSRGKNYFSVLQFQTYFRHVTWRRVLQRRPKDLWYFLHISASFNPFLSLSHLLIFIFIF